ncbi:MAG: TonB family protein [Leptolyngbyaceae cyanobacterium CRU_2_3]|nr:TonB family protein [Leptolyngbyaceae cyanobacterium CRU_2_3]
MRNWLSELRQARQRSRQATNSGGAPTRTSGGGSSSNSGGTNPGSTNSGSTTGGTGTSVPGAGSGSSTAVGPGRPGLGAGGSNGNDNGGGESDRPTRNSGSRQVSCRGCDFDYPESANGVEGTATVRVETDDRGRVVSVTLSGSSGNAELDRAALEQARERVRLRGARAGESYPIQVDFVQPGSDADRRSTRTGQSPDCDSAQS